jgi:hypothetical protein
MRHSSLVKVSKRRLSVLVALACLAVASDAVASGVFTDPVLARRMTLRLSDFDAGWWARRSHASFSGDCGVKGLTPVGYAVSPEIVDLGDWALSAASVDRTRAQAKTTYEDVGQPSTAACIRKSLAIDGWRNITVARVAFRSVCGSTSRCPFLARAWRFRARKRYRLTEDVVVSLRGRAVAVFFFFYTTLRVFSGDERALVGAAMGRGSDK